MSGTREGGLKTALKLGKDHYRSMGRTGGERTWPTKGFAANRKLARIAGRKGGTISKRRKAQKEVA